MRRGDLRRSSIVDVEALAFGNAMLYGMLNALVGLAIGLYLWEEGSGSESGIFAFSAPIAASVVGFLTWKWSAPSSSGIGSLQTASIGLITGSVSHYVTFCIISIYMNLCYWLTGGCTGSLGDPPLDLLSSIAGNLVFTFWSLLLFGWITIPASIFMAFAIWQLTRGRSRR